MKSFREATLVETEIISNPFTKEMVQIAIMTLEPERATTEELTAACNFFTKDVNADSPPKLCKMIQVFPAGQDLLAKTQSICDRRQTDKSSIHKFVEIHQRLYALTKPTEETIATSNGRTIF